jgi:hypothetical protein
MPAPFGPSNEIYGDKVFKLPFKIAWQKNLVSSCFGPVTTPLNVL